MSGEGTNESPELAKTWSQRIGWIKVLVAAACALLAAGAIAQARVGNLATKEEVRQAVTEHAAMPHPLEVKRIDDLERWRDVHTAETRADTWWIKQALKAQLQQQGVQAPPERPVEPPSIGPAR